MRIGRRKVELELIHLGPAMSEDGVWGLGNGFRKDSIGHTMIHQLPTLEHFDAQDVEGFSTFALLCFHLARITHFLCSFFLCLWSRDAAPAGCARLIRHPSS